MKKILLTLLILCIILGLGYYFVTKGPAREELVFAGNYQSFESTSGSISSDKVTVLSFYASRCPSCRAAHDNIVSEINQLPATMQILNVDYDTNTELRQKYGVTSQHTFVLVDRDGNKIKMIQGLNHVSEVIDFVGDYAPTPVVVEELINTGTTASTGTEASTEVTATDDMKTPSAGMYMSYASGKSYIADTAKKVVLFFHASRCPSCVQTDKNITAAIVSIPSDVVILKVDYDNAADMKKQYAVTSQHTFVSVDAQGEKIKKTTGLSTVTDIVAFIQ